MVYPAVRQTEAVCPLKRRGDVPRSKLGRDPSSSETGNIPTKAIETIDKRERLYQAFGTFLQDFVRDLNNSAEGGWSLLVEGLRDERAVRKLGYAGEVLTVSVLRRAHDARGKKVIVLTDLDREGTVLASKFVKSLYHDGARTSLSERRRLKAASRGVFLHIENLSRFATADHGRWERPLGVAPPKPTRIYREGLRRFRRRAASF
jgi:5S rRNA maturation endonuclease (ribonuclease M5)